MTMVSVSAEARPANVSSLRDAVTDAAREAGMPEDLLYDVKLCVSEAATNAVNHAYEDEGGVVRVDARVVEDEFVVDVVDEGRGIELGRPVEGGCGLEIISQLSPRSWIETAPGRGTMVEMSFPLAGTAVNDLPWEPKTSISRYFAF